MHRFDAALVALLQFECLLPPDGLVPVQMTLPAYDSSIGRSEMSSQRYRGKSTLRVDSPRLFAHSAAPISSPLATNLFGVLMEVHQNNKTTMVRA